ncbi:MAG: sigma-E processing peptidase SpoIIGA [Firmicutes bacterium]|nr:sigma-E processing peptidase SpoIIGA [Bacillota bacterium]
MGRRTGCCGGGRCFWCCPAPLGACWFWCPWRGAAPPGPGGLLGPSLGMRGILIAAALSYGALSLVLGRQFSKTQAEGGLCPLTLTKGEKTLRLLALIDTGNTLRDPLTGEGVVVLDCGRAGALVPELAGVPAQAFQRPVELLARFAGEEPDLRLLPYQAVGVPCGLLLAVRVDEAAWGGQRRPRCLCALSPTPLSDGGGYHALVGGEHP